MTITIIFISQVGSESDAIKAVDLAKKNFSKLHILVNCAGSAVACKTFNIRRRQPHPLDLFENIIKVGMWVHKFSSRCVAVV